jgi:mRNA-degrading endonuclease RelE of RelBE toxin-antitoxin system
LERFYETLDTLGENPDRCALAPESKKLRRDLRQLLFGRKPNVFRVIFSIHEDEVEVVRIRRASRRPLRRADLDES